MNILEEETKLNEIAVKLRQRYPDEYILDDTRIEFLLIIAIENEDLEIVRSLSELSTFKEININFQARYPVLKTAMKIGNLEILALLLKANINLNIRNSQGEAPLGFAINKQADSIIELLFNKKNNNTDLGSKIIDFIKGHFLKKLLRDNEQSQVISKVNQQNNLKLTTLIACGDTDQNAKRTANQLYNQAQVILKNSKINNQFLNITVGLQTDKNKNYHLFFIINSNQLMKINLNIKDAQGKTPFDIAIRRQPNSMIEFLITSKAEPLSAINLGSEIIDFIKRPFLTTLLKDKSQSEVISKFDQQNNLKLTTRIVCGHTDQNPEGTANQLYNQAQVILKNSKINNQPLNINISLKKEKNLHPDPARGLNYYLIFDINLNELIKHSQQINQIINIMVVNNLQPPIENLVESMDTSRENSEQYINNESIENNVSRFLAIYPKQNIISYLGAAELTNSLERPAELINSLNIREVVEIVQANKFNQQQVEYQIVDPVIEDSQPNSNDQTHLAKLQKERENQNQQNHR